MPLQTRLEKRPPRTCSGRTSSSMTHRPEVVSRNEIAQSNARTETLIRHE